MAMPRHWPALFAVLIAAAIPVLPGVPIFWITLLDNVGLAALVAMGLVLLTGVGGLTSFGQAAFCGIAAYTTAVLSTTYGISPWLTLPIALAATVATALLLGLITMRLKGHYLPLGTIAWGISLYYLFGKLDILGRHDGIVAIPPLSIGGFALTDGRAIYYVIWTAVILAALATRNLLSSRTGRAIRALRGGGIAATAFGVDVARVKLIVFVYAALLAGVSGWLYAHMQRAVNPTPFGINAGIEYLFMAVVGGAGTVPGAILGAGVVTFLKDWLQRLLPQLFGSQGNYETIVFGALLIVFLQTARDGLWPRIAGLFKSAGTAGPVPPADAAPLAHRTMPAAGSALLTLAKARRTFGGLVAVNDVSFAVPAGEIAGLIGPNGAGKSTTFNLITGVLAATAGEIHYQGRRIDRLASNRIAGLGIGRTFQHVNVRPTMSVLENVAIGAHLRGHKGTIASILRLDRAEERRLLHTAKLQIERVGLAEHMLKPAGSLALGQLRILEIARALCLDPALLLLDEPAAGLRHLEKEALANLLRELKRDGLTVLLVEHDMAFVMGLVDHLVVLDFGTLIADGRPAEVRANPAVVEAYLGGPE